MVQSGERATSEHVILWEFLVKPGREKEFERIYGPEGDWARLFARAEGYVRSDLLRDLSDGRRYLTVDVWTSQQAYERFRAQHREEYQSIDRRCEDLTEKEARLGAFVALP